MTGKEGDDEQRKEAVVKEPTAQPPGSKAGSNGAKGPRPALFSTQMRVLALSGLALGVLWAAMQAMTGSSSADAAEVTAEHNLTLHPPAGQVFTKDALSAYNTEEAGLYLAILGQVFNVSSNPKMYGSKGYGFFLGRDSSRAFTTGKFKEDLNDNITDFDPEQVQGLLGWRQFYHKDYQYVGVVEGAFYDAQGRARQEAADWLARQHRLALRNAQVKKDSERRRPDCSKRWSQRDGALCWAGVAVR